MLVRMGSLSRLTGQSFLVSVGNQVISSYSRQALLTGASKGSLSFLQSSGAFVSNPYTYSS